MPQMAPAGTQGESLHMGSLVANHVPVAGGHPADTDSHNAKEKDKQASYKVSKGPEQAP